MEASSIIALATEVSKVINNIVDRLPSYEQKQMEALYAFLDKYEEEVSRSDADFDDLLLWNNRKRLFFDTLIEQITRSRRN